MADVSVTAANFIPGTNAVYRKDQKAGEAITRGQVVYRDKTDSNKWKKADANASALTAGNGTDIGLACQDVGANQYFDVLLEDDDLTPGFTSAVNTIYIMSATAGGIAPAADLTTGWYGIILMIGKSTSKTNFKPIKSGVAS